MYAILPPIKSSNLLTRWIFVKLRHKLGFKKILSGLEYTRQISVEISLNSSAINISDWKFRRLHNVSKHNPFWGRKILLFSMNFWPSKLSFTLIFPAQPCQRSTTNYFLRSVNGNSSWGGQGWALLSKCNQQTFSPCATHTYNSLFTHTNASKKPGRPWKFTRESAKQRRAPLQKIANFQNGDTTNEGAEGK